MNGLVTAVEPENAKNTATTTNINFSAQSPLVEEKLNQILHFYAYPPEN